MSMGRREKIDEAKTLDDQEKLFELAALGLSSLFGDQEQIETLLPVSLKTSLRFAKRVCANDPTLVSQFDPNIVKSQEFLLHVFKNNRVKDLVSIEKTRATRESFQEIIALIPSELKKDRAFVLQAVKFCPVLIYNWCASEYENDEEFEAYFIEHFYEDRAFYPVLTRSIGYALAVKLCQFNGANYNFVKRHHPTDVPLACIAVSAPNGDRIYIKELDRSIRYNATRLARVIASSIQKESIHADLEEQELNVIAKGVYKIDASKEELRYSDQVYKAAQFICAHEDAKLEKASLKKILTKPAQKVPKRSALKDTL